MSKPKESKARRTAFAEYNKQRRRIQNQLRRNEAKGIFSAMEVPPTATQLRKQGIKTNTLKARTRKLSQITGRQITRESQGVDVTTGEIITPQARLAQIRRKKKSLARQHRIDNDRANGATLHEALVNEEEREKQRKHAQSERAKKLAKKRKTNAQRRQEEIELNRQIAKNQRETQLQSGWAVDRRKQDEIDRKRLQSDAGLQRRLNDAQMAFDRANDVIDNQRTQHGNSAYGLELAQRNADAVSMLMKQAIDAAGGYDKAMKNISNNIQDFEESVNKALNYHDATETATARSRLFSIIAGRGLTLEESQAITEEAEQSEYLDDTDLFDIQQSTFDTP